MAIYRNVQLSFWTDNKIEDDFTPEDKYFYLYLMTNPQTNICGCYEYSYSQMARHTGYNKDTIIRLLDRFQNFHKVIQYDAKTKEVLLLNWYKYNWSKSEKTLSGVENVAKYIKSESLRNQVFSIIDLVRNDTPCMPHIYPIQASVSDTVSDTDSVICNSVNKKENYKDIYNRIIKEFNISNYLLEYVENWIEYKRERKFTYKERGMRTLLKTISERSEKYGDESVASAIEESISSGYQGIVWDKVTRKVANHNGQFARTTKKYNDRLFSESGKGAMESNGSLF